MGDDDPSAVASGGRFHDSPPSSSGGRTVPVQDKQKQFASVTASHRGISLPRHVSIICYEAFRSVLTRRRERFVTMRTTCLEHCHQCRWRQDTARTRLMKIREVIRVSFSSEIDFPAFVERRPVLNPQNSVLPLYGERALRGSSLALAALSAVEFSG